MALFKDFGFQYSVLLTFPVYQVTSSIKYRQHTSTRYRETLLAELMPLNVVLSYLHIELPFEPFQKVFFLQKFCRQL